MSSSTAQKLVTAAERRRVRFAAQRMLWTESVRKRGRHCGRSLASSFASVDNGKGGRIVSRVEGELSAQLRVTTDVEGKHHAGFAGVQTCGSVWACPVCSAKVLAHRQGEIAQAVETWEATGGRVAMFTFTMRHNASQSVSSLWDALSLGWSSITRGRAYMAERATYGLPVQRTFKSGKREGETVTSTVIPWVRVVEATHGDRFGWHLHIHALVFLGAGVTDDEMHDLYESWWLRWSAGLSAAGIDGSLRVNRAQWCEAKTEIAGYVTKNTYTETTVVRTAGEQAGFEVARGDLKDGRFDNRSPFQILRDLIHQPSGPEAAERDGMLWAQFEHASQGRRQMTWALGSRDLFGLDDERSDDEIAAEEVGTRDDAVLVIPQRGWAMFRERAGLRADVLELAESVGPEYARAVVGAFLDEHGVPWRDTDAD